MIVRLLATDTRVWDLDVPDLEMANVRVIQFMSMTFLCVADDFRDAKWLRLFRQVQVKFLRGQHEKSLDQKRQEYLEVAGKKLDEAYERGRRDMILEAARRVRSRVVVNSANEAEALERAAVEIEAMKAHEGGKP